MPFEIPGIGCTCTECQYTRKHPQLFQEVPMNATQRQEIPVLSVVRTAEEIRRDDEAVSALLDLFDLVLDQHKRLVTAADRVPGFKVIGGHIALFASSQPLAEYCLQLWCSVHKEVEFVERRYEHGGDRYHVIHARLDGRDFISWQDSAPIATACGDHGWRPTDGGAA